MDDLNEYVIYIPEEGAWTIPGLHKDKTSARLAYLEWANRKRMPKGSWIYQQV